MTPARSAVVVKTVTELLADVVAEQARQREMLATILRLLERGRGARDAADMALLEAVAEATRDHQFTSAHLLEHVAADPALRDALEAADITSARELGAVFRRLQGIAMRGFRLDRVGDTREGILWCVRVCEAQTRTAGYSDL